MEFRAAPKLKRAYWFDIVRLVLFLITLYIVVNHEKLTEQTFVINASDDFNRFVLDDAVNNGGNSFAEWLDFNTKKWRCELGDGYMYYYCQEVIQLDERAESGYGMDLRAYSEVEIFYEYKGPVTDSLRFSLLNFNDEYSKPYTPLSNKINEFEFRPLEYGRSITIPFEKFTVPNWWILEQKVPTYLSDAEFSNVTTLQIQTGSKDTLGVKEIQIQRVVFRGQSISAETLYQGVLVFWIGFFGITGTIRFFNIARELRTERTARSALNQEYNSLAKMAHELETKAYTDPLTGVLNRAGFEKVLNAKIQSTEFASFGMLVVDLDHFKSINDKHGHNIGDEVLTKVGSLLRESRRQDDIVARWGGEEFVMLVPASDLNKVRALAEKIRKAIAQDEWPNSINVTASIGISLTHQNEDIDAAFNRADVELYKAKRNGRNMVCG